jgi:hypothetical protein
MLSFLGCYHLCFHFSQSANVIIYMSSFSLVHILCYHLRYHLMLSFFVIISPLFSFSWKRDTLLFFFFFFHKAAQKFKTHLHIYNKYWFDFIDLHTNIFLSGDPVLFKHRKSFRIFHAFRTIACMRRACLVLSQKFSARWQICPTLSGFSEKDLKICRYNTFHISSSLLDSLNKHCST